jgi:hypothetical protein
MWWCHLKNRCKVSTGERNRTNFVSIRNDFVDENIKLSTWSLVCLILHLQLGVVVVIIDVHLFVHLSQTYYCNSNIHLEKQKHQLVLPKSTKSNDNCLIALI